MCLISSWLRFSSFIFFRSRLLKDNLISNLNEMIPKNGAIRLEPLIQHTRFLKMEDGRKGDYEGFVAVDGGRMGELKGDWA